MDLKKWSIGIFTTFIILFFLLGIFKSNTMTWIWQLSLPVLLILQVYVILKAKKESKKNFPEDHYDQD
jgi:4-hydroxybenzoate polyprenyltransferase